MADMAGGVEGAEPLDGAPPEVGGRGLQEITYRLGLVIKGIDGLFELIAGLVLWLAPGLLTALLAPIARVDSDAEVVRRFLAHWAGLLTEHLESGVSPVVIFFLLSHGIVKLALVYCLLRNYLWAYVPALVILSLFAVYQLVLLVQRPSVGLAALLALDLVIVWLVWREWRVMVRPGRREKWSQQ